MSLKRMRKLVPQVGKKDERMSGEPNCSTPATVCAGSCRALLNPSMHCKSGSDACRPSKTFPVARFPRMPLVRQPVFEPKSAEAFSSASKMDPKFWMTARTSFARVGHHVGQIGFSPVGEAEMGYVREVGHQSGR